MYACVRIGAPYAHHVYETLICRSVQWQRAPYLAIVYIHTSRYPPCDGLAHACKSTRMILGLAQACCLKNSLLETSYFSSRFVNLTCSFRCDACPCTCVIKCPNQTPQVDVRKRLIPPVIFA